MSDEPKAEPAAVVARLCEASDYPGEAAERIAAELGLSFGDALAMMREWEREL